MSGDMVVTASVWRPEVTAVRQQVTGVVTANLGGDKAILFFEDADELRRFIVDLSVKAEGTMPGFGSVLQARLWSAGMLDSQ